MRRRTPIPRRKEHIVGITSFKLPILALVATALAMTSAASGSTIDPSVVFTLGNHPQPGEENVVLNKGTTGTTLFGQTNMTHLPVQFTSTQTLIEPASGQARVEATSGGLTNITISAPGHTFGDLIMNPDVTGTVGTPGGRLDVSVTDIHGQVFVFAYTLGHGSNFITITTTGGDSILSTTLQYSLAGGFTDLRQIRISGLTVIPEPGTLSLFGTGLLGLAGLFR